MEAYSVAGTISFALVHVNKASSLLSLRERLHRGKAWRVMETVGRDPGAQMERASSQAGMGMGGKHSPGQICEAPVQVHGGGTAAEHGQDAFQV